MVRRSITLHLLLNFYEFPWFTYQPWEIKPLLSKKLGITCWQNIGIVTSEQDICMFISWFAIDNLDVNYSCSYNKYSFHCFPVQAKSMVKCAFELTYKESVEKAPYDFLSLMVLFWFILSSLLKSACYSY